VSTQTADTVVALRGLGHSYGSRRALNQLSIELVRGEIVGLMGPNGSGKSTAFALLTGLLPLRDGSLEYQGRQVTPRDWRFRRDIGVVFQDASLDSKLTAEENLFLTARMHGFPKSSIRGLIDLGLERAGITDRAKDLVGTLSGGLRRRLDLARAMLHRPAFLLMDEPTTGLDLESFEQTWRLLELLRDTGDTAILLTTHRPDEARRCDRLAVLREGECIRTATPTELLREAGEDVLVLETPTPDHVASRIHEALELDAMIAQSDRVSLQIPKAQEWVVPIANLFDPETIHAIHVRRPGLADAYFKVTGSRLKSTATEED
jgi:ABC-2 type transport system ATP-binding protein